MPSKQRRADRRLIWSLAIGGALVFAVVISAYAVWFHHTGISHSPEDWSRFGEYVGGLAGTLLALITLLVLVYTLHVQAEQLDDTRAELAKQSSSIAKQNFENTFFKLLELIQSRVASLRWTQPTKELTGRDVVHWHSNELHRRFVALQNAIQTRQPLFAGHPPLVLDIMQVLTAYRSWHREVAPIIDSYLRLIYRTMVAIDRSEVNEKQLYVDILWDSLSPDEKHILFYHGLTQIPSDQPPLTAPDFGSLLKRYRMFETFGSREADLIPKDRLDWYNQIPG